MIVEYETIMYKNVVWHSYEIHYSQLERALTDFNDKLVQASLTVVGPLFYGLKNIPSEEVILLDVYMPVAQSYVAKNVDLHFQSYFYIDQMLMTRVRGNFEVNTEVVYNELLQYAIDKEYKIVSPIFHIIRGDDEIQWVELKVKVYSESDDDFFEKEAKSWDYLLNLFDEKQMIGGEGQLEKIEKPILAEGVSTQENKNSDRLTLQILKTDAEAGITLENHDVYKTFNEIILENPNLGIANDFSIQILDVIEVPEDSTDKKLSFFAINRLNKSIKNISFYYTLGNNEGKHIYKSLGVDLSESVAGVIEANSVVPFYLEISDEQIEVLRMLQQENTVMDFEDFKYEIAD